MTTEPNLRDSSSSWAAEIQTLVITPEDFTEWTGLDIKNVEEARTVKKTQKRYNQADRLIMPILSRLLQVGYLFIVFSFSLIVLIGIIGLMIILIRAGISLQYVGVAGILCTPLLILILLSSTAIKLADTHDKKTNTDIEIRQLEGIFPLLDELERFHKILKLMEISDLTDTPENLVFIDNNERDKVLKQVKTLRGKLEISLKLERIFREDPSLKAFNPMDLGLDIATGHSHKLIAVGKEYQNLLKETLEISNTIEQEANRLQAEVSR